MSVKVDKNKEKIDETLFSGEAISEAVSKGGFPQLLLAPINFEAYFQEKKKQAQAV